MPNACPARTIYLKSERSEQSLKHKAILTFPVGLLDLHNTLENRIQK